MTPPLMTHNEYIIWIICLFIITCNGQPYPIAKCDDIINGMTTADDTTHWYLFSADNATTKITIDACNATFMTTLELYDKPQSAEPIAYNDYSDLCNGFRALLTCEPLNEQNYYIAITGFFYTYGNYSLKITCSSTRPSYQCMILSNICLRNVLTHPMHDQITSAKRVLIMKTVDQMPMHVCSLYLIWFSCHFIQNSYIIQVQQCIMYPL